MDKLKALLLYGSQVGLPFVGAYDALSGKPSVTLLAVHVTLWLTVGILLYSLHSEATSQTWAAITFWAVANVFYLIRKITKFKLDADDRSIELEGGDDDKNG